MSDWKFIIAAYTITWVVYVSYAVYLETGVRRRARARLRAAMEQARS
jgi:hypothetical protein